MEAALEGKLKKHRAAVNTFGDIFIPTAMGIYGEFHASVYGFLRKAFAHLHGHLKTLAIVQTKRSMSEAWLIGTMAMVNGFTNRQFLEDPAVMANVGVW